MRVAPITDVSIVNINAREQQTVEPPSKIKNYAIRAGVLLSFIGNVVISYIIMQNKNRQLAKIYFLYITPSSGFFKVWIFIYSVLSLAIAHNVWKDIWRMKSSLVFILSNCLMIIHVAIWSARSVASIVISGLVLAVVDNIIIWFWRILIDQHLQSLQETVEQQTQNLTQNQIQNPSNVGTLKKVQEVKRYTQIQLLIVRNIFSLYIGWVTVVGTVILGLTEVYLFGISLCAQFIVFWITTPIAAVALYLFLALKQQNQYRYSFGFVLSVLYGVIAAGITSANHITQNNYC